MWVYPFHTFHGLLNRDSGPRVTYLSSSGMDVSPGSTNGGPDHSFKRQMHFEDEGGRAWLAGQSRDNCPYDRETQSFEWNHWVYGNDKARGEMETIRRGGPLFLATTEPGCIPSPMPLKEAVERGYFAPRYANLPDSLLHKRST